MDPVPLDVVRADVADGFHRVHLAANLDFVARHGLFDGGADITDADVDAGGLLVDGC